MNSKLPSETSHSKSGMHIADESFAESAELAVGSIVSSYVKGQITLKECLRQIKREQELPFGGMGPIPRYSDWVVVAALRFIEENYQESPAKLAELKDAILS